MEITIIEYTPEQFAALTVEQIKEVRSAEVKKLALERALEEKLAEEKNKLIDRGVFLSSIWERLKEKLQAEHDAEVEALRHGLLFYLHYYTEHMKLQEEDLSNIPYEVDYALSEADRMKIVRDYYLGAYEDAEIRLDEFKKDEFAKTYLGELYAPLYDYFYDLIEQ